MHPDRVMNGESGFFATVDEVQLARARRGDIGALEDLYRLYSTPVFTLARRIGRSQEEAEEILQETFLEMLRILRSYEPEEDLTIDIIRHKSAQTLTGTVPRSTHDSVFWSHLRQPGE
jgi:hypothetical protein